MKTKLSTRICATGILVASLSIPSTARAESPFDGLVMPRKFYINLARCETGNNPAHSSRSYTGMFGIYRGTYQRWSNASSAKRHTPRQQAKVVDKIAWLGHTEPDGEFVWPVGPWGWGAIKANCLDLRDFICKSKHRKVLRWKRGC